MSSMFKISNKIDNIFLGVDSGQKPHKRSLKWLFLLVQRHLKILNLRTTDPISEKLDHYVYQLKTFPLLKTQILTLISLENSS